MALGTIQRRKTKDGRIRYRVRWETIGADGKRHHHSETVDTPEEAQTLRLDKLLEVRRGFGRPATNTLADYLDRWLTATSGSRNDHTTYSYRSIIRARINPRLGSMRLDRLTALQIQAAWSEMLAQGYAPSTTGLTHTILKAALAQAVAWRLLATNPADGVDPPRADHGSVTTTWTATEARRFLALTADDPLHALWRLGLDSGMRLGELLALTWANTNLTTGVIIAHRTASRNLDGKIILGHDTKTRRRGRRSIPVTPSTVAALRQHQHGQKERRLALAIPWQALDLVFDRGDGGLWRPATVEWRFDRAVAPTGLPRLTPHDMRHTMATLMLAAGVHPAIVKERLGHSSIAMTLDRYSHVSMTMQREATAALEVALG